MDKVKLVFEKISATKLQLFNAIAKRVRPIHSKSVGQINSYMAGHTGWRSTKVKEDFAKQIQRVFPNKKRVSKETFAKADKKFHPEYYSMNELDKTFKVLSKGKKQELLRKFKYIRG